MTEFAFVRDSSIDNICARVVSFAALALRVRAANDTTRAPKLLKNAGAQAIKESIE